MIIKLDMANTFDKVKHKFLYRLMEKLGFGKKFIQWINFFIGYPWISPLVNDIVSIFFKYSRGIWQWYFLSPFPYILVLDTMSKKLELERKNGHLLGFHYTHDIKSGNHSQFMDNTILLRGALVTLDRRFK